MTDEKDDQLEIRSTSPIRRKTSSAAGRDDRADGSARDYRRGGDNRLGRLDNRAGGGDNILGRMDNRKNCSTSNMNPLTIFGIILTFAVFFAIVWVLFFSQSNPAETYARQQGISPQISEMLIPLGTGDLFEYNKLSSSEKKFIHCLSQLPVDEQLRIIDALEKDWQWHAGDQQMSFTCTVKYFDDDAGAFFIDSFLEDGYISGYESNLINYLQEFYVNYLNFNLIKSGHYEYLERFAQDGNLTGYEMEFARDITNLAPSVRDKLAEKYIRSDRDMIVGENDVKLVEHLGGFENADEALNLIENYTRDGVISDFEIVTIFSSGENITINCPVDYKMKIEQAIKILKEKDRESYALVLMHGNNIKCCNELEDICPGTGVYSPNLDKVFIRYSVFNKSVICELYGISPCYISKKDIMPDLLEVLVHEAKHGWQEHTKDENWQRWSWDYDTDVEVCTEIEYEAYAAAYEMLGTVYPDNPENRKENPREDAQRQCRCMIEHDCG